MAKAASDDCQRLVCRESFQSFGGIGFTWEHDGHLFIKRAETDGALFGGAARALAGRGRPRWAWHRLAAERDRLTACAPGNRSSPSSGLEPHPEGGWYRRTWVAAAGAGERPAGSAIYYLLLEGEVSAPHRIDATELWHFYAGDPLELHARMARRRGRDVPVLGADVAAGQPPQARGRAGGVAVGPPARALRPGRGDGHTGVHLRGVRACAPRRPDR